MKKRAAPSGEGGDDQDVSIEAVLRRLVRDELAKMPAIHGGDDRADTRKQPRGETAMLFVFVLDFALIVALFPSVDGALKPFVEALTTLGASAFTLGYTKLKRDALKALHWRSTKHVAVALLAPLTAAHVLMRIPLIPVTVDPPDAVLMVEGGNPVVGPDRLRVTLADGKITASPRLGSHLKAQVLEPSIGDRVLAVGGRRLSVALRCTALLDLDSAGASVELRRRGGYDLAFRKTFQLDPRTAIVVQRIEGDRLLLQFLSDNGTVDLPVGSYQVTATTACKKPLAEFTIDDYECAQNGTKRIPLCES